MLEQTTKQPAERFRINFNFQKVLQAGESITSANIAASLFSDGTDKTSEIIVDDTQITDGVVSVKVKDGADGETYRVEVQAETSDGNLFEKDILLKVENE